jgi:hypothetical protein
LDFELVAADAGLVDLLDRKLDALLVLGAEIGARSRHREQPPDLDRLVLGAGGVGVCEQPEREAEIQRGRVFPHGTLLKAMVS